MLHPPVQPHVQLVQQEHTPLQPVHHLVPPVVREPIMIWLDLAVVKHVPLGSIRHQELLLVQIVLQDRMLLLLVVLHAHFVLQESIPQWMACLCVLIVMQGHILVWVPAVAYRVQQERIQGHQEVLHVQPALLDPIQMLVP